MPRDCPCHKGILTLGLYLEIHPEGLLRPGFVVPRMPVVDGGELRVVVTSLEQEHLRGRAEGEIVMPVARTDDTQGAAGGYDKSLAFRVQHVGNLSLILT